MKKTILGLMLSFISICGYSCRLEPLGWCSGKAYFITQEFFNHSDVEVRYFGTTVVIYSFTTAATGSTDVTFSVSQPIQSVLIGLQFRFKDVGETTWGAWSLSNTSISSIYAHCSTLGVTIRNFDVQKVDETHVLVKFSVDNAAGVNYYNIVVATIDGATRKVALKIPADSKPNFIYSQIITLPQ